MPPVDREPSHPLLRFAQDIGEIKAGVRSLDDGQRRADKKITDLNRSVAHLVTREDCQAHRDDVTEKIDTALFATVEPATAPRNRRTLLDLAGQKAGAIAAILTLLSMLIVGVIVVSRFVGSLERAIDQDRKQQQMATEQVLSELRKTAAPVVVQPAAPVKPDAGRPRRRRRRTGGRQ